MASEEVAPTEAGANQELTFPCPASAETERAWRSLRQVVYFQESAAV